MISQARPILQTMIDAESPHWASAPVGASVAAGYLGGAFAAGAWAETNWQYAKAARFSVNPIWVPRSIDNAATDAAELIARADLMARGLGFPSFPRGAVLTIDVEHSQAAGHTAAALVDLLAGHYLRDFHTLVYSSETDHELFSSWSQWLGSWTGSAHDLALAPAAVQWDGGPGHAWDVSAVFEHLPFFNPSSPTGGVTTMEYPGFATHEQSGGYVQCDTLGRVYAYGGAPYYGGVPASTHLLHPVSGIEWTPTGRGYRMFCAGDGAVLCFGDAKYHGHAPMPNR